MRAWNPTLRGLGGAFLLLLVALLPTPARADDEPKAAPSEELARTSDLASERYDRQQLVRRALQSVLPGRMEADGVARAREQVKERRAEFLEAHRPSVEEADDLVDGEPGRGLIGEAARLYAWAAYAPPPSIQDASIPLAEVDKSHPVIVYAGTEERPDFAALLPPGDEADLPADVRASRELARQVAAARLRDRTLDVLRRSDGTIRLGESDRKRFLDIARAAMTAKPDGGGEADTPDATQLALLDAQELTSRLSRAWIAARGIQVRERLEAFAADVAPTGLVSEQAVEEKQQLAERLQAEAARLERRAAGLTGTLDGLVKLEKDLTRALATLGSKLEEAKEAVEAEEKARAEAERQAKEAEAARKAKEAEEAEAAKEAEQEGKAAPDLDGAGEDAPKKDPGEGEDEGAGEAPEAPVNEGGADAPAEKTEAERQLMSLQLQEAVLKLKMRLLYLTVHRAVLRRELYEKAVSLAKEEATAAAGVAGRFRAELNRMRREQQLEMLDNESTKLEQLLTDATSRAEDPSHANLPLWKAWKTMLEHYKAAYRLTREAVMLRRSFEAKLSPPRKVESETSADNGDAATDAMRRFRHPRRVAFDKRYVTDAREALSDPAFDRGLVALHHEVVSERIEALSSALGLVADDDRIQQAFEQEVQTAEQALAGLQAEVDNLPQGEDRQQWTDVLEGTRQQDFTKPRKAFQETVRGLDEKAAEARQLLAASRAFERELRKLGPRSFGIRIDRSLDGEKLGAAYDDAQDTADKAARWITGRSEESLGTWLRANWLTLLLCLAVIVASVLFVRFARRGLDRLIGGIARKIPALRFEPVTVRAEEAHAKREKAEQELAAKAAEEEALRLVSKEEAGKAQRMGEGGYSGGSE